MRREKTVFSLLYQMLLKSNANLSIFLIMDNTIVIQVINHKALGIIHELEELNLIKVLKENLNPARSGLSDKYKGVFSKEDAKNFDDHTQTMRGEWNNT